MYSIVYCFLPAFSSIMVFGLEVLGKSVDKMFPGFRVLLNMLVRDPVGTYNMLRENYGDGVDIVLKTLLGKLIDDESLINRVVESLKKGDPDLFNQLIRRTMVKTRG